MKVLFFLAIMPLLALQMTIMAHPNGEPHAHELEVQIQNLPSPNESNADDNRSMDNPETLAHPKELERTLSIIKPDGVKNRHIGDIISRFEKAGLHVAALKLVKLNKEQASQFYNIHRDRPFFSELVNFMSSGPVVIMVLEGDNAVNKNRQLMGATDPRKAEKGTIRADFAESMSKNSVHGSDSPETAREEISFFFQSNEIYSD
jgi:nucleoside diphosphate kinase